MKRIVAVISLMVVFLFAFSGAYALQESESLRESFIRLHIRANSDGEEDQRVKLLVRDAVLLETQELFSECGSPQEAMLVTEQELSRFEDAANRALEEEGAPYRASVEYGDSYFPIRTYGQVTLPAGTYHSLIIRLGSGEGHNWWCVMFPPLCYTGEGEVDGESLKVLKENLSQEDYNAVVQGDKIIVKWKIAELWQQFWTQVTKK